MKVLLLLSLLCLSSCSRVVGSPDTTVKANNTEKKLFMVAVGGKFGYIDETGKIIVNPQFDASNPFAEGLALVCVGPCDLDHWRGYRIAANPYGLEPANTKGPETEKLEQTFKYGYIDQTGKMVINPMFENAQDFSEGMAGVCVGPGCYFNVLSDKPKEEGKWGFIDKTGTLVIPPQFSRVWTFHEGLASVSVGGKWGYVDKKGKFAINPQYDLVNEFQNGVAKVCLKMPSTDPSDKDDISPCGYIDRTGKYIWQPSR